MTASQDKILAIRAAHPEHGKRMSRFDRTIDRIEAREDWRSGYGQKGGLGPNTGKKAVKFLCPHPLGIQRADEVKIKRVFDSGAADWANPVALWYKAQGEWHLNTVVDGDNVPDWAKHYTTYPATRA